MYAFYILSSLLSIVLFVFVIRYVLRLNPKTELSRVVTDVEIKICEKNYKWLRNSSFITIPVFLIAGSMIVPAIAVLIPFIFHIPIINRLKTESLFVFRHTQQTLLLLLLRAATTTFIFTFYYFYDASFWLFILVNGSLWLFGTNWEIKQVKNNDSWLMRRRGEEIILPVSTESESPDTSLINQNAEETLTSIDKKIRTTTIKKSLNAFRTGTSEERKKALLVLSELGEVEKF